jgi:hypothetical protein
VHRRGPTIILIRSTVLPLQQCRPHMPLVNIVILQGLTTIHAHSIAPQLLQFRALIRRGSIVQRANLIIIQEPSIVLARYRSQLEVPSVVLLPALSSLL